ncbi:phospholipase D-like domain-containing protein [Dyadobacter bucti]|uniref:phospholipase D-like domain-containing protein n=1 Tax=Dyadobacter bucti TaxID=2572203 RepID=UPI003F710274
MAYPLTTLDNFFHDWLTLELFDRSYVGSYEQCFNAYFENRHCQKPVISIHNLSIFRSQVDAVVSRKFCSECEISSEALFLNRAESKDRISNLYKAQCVSSVNVNTATVDDLRQIPGINQRTATLIHEKITENGKITDLAEIVSLGYMSAQSYALAKPYLATVNGKSISDEDGLLFKYMDFPKLVKFKHALSQNPKGAAAEMAANELVIIVNEICKTPIDGSSLPNILVYAGAMDQPNSDVYTNFFKNRDECYLAVLDSTEYLKLLGRLITKAEKSILVMAPALNLLYIRDLKVILDALIEAQQKNINVRVIYDKTYSPGFFVSDDIQYLESNGVFCIGVDYKFRTHSRVVLVDNEHILCGSQSWSANSFYHSLETSAYIKSMRLADELLHNHPILINLQ